MEDYQKITILTEAILIGETLKVLLKKGVQNEVCADIISKTSGSEILARCRCRPRRFFFDECKKEKRSVSKQYKR